MVKCPCKNCTDRTLTCHGVCEKYAAFRKEKEAENAYNRRNDMDVISRRGLRKHWANLTRRRQ